VTIEKIAVALANADGGEFIVGVEDQGSDLNAWRGFEVMEHANYVLQSLQNNITPPVPYTVEWYRVQGALDSGVACLVSVQKSDDVHRTSAGKVLVRRGAQSLEITGQAITDLALSKGARSYEDQLLAKYDISDLVAEDELRFFLDSYSPQTDPDQFVQKQRLIDRDSGEATVASAILFAEHPSAVVPKRCAVKVARYETKDLEPRREHLKADPVTIEGPARDVIDETIKTVTEMVESVSVLRADGGMAPMSYPPDALKEIIVNAVIHRDYNVSDDTLVLVFDNRVEVRSPGKLPGHMTVSNLLTDRFARNPTIVRLLNKYPDAPNKDIGEGLNTVVAKMAEAKLQQPRFHVDENTFVVVLGHQPLARPQEIVLEYLSTNAEITNSIGRSITGITSENSMKDVFISLAKAGKLERVPDKAGNRSAWRTPETQPQETLS
jgi:ATP-dependent DNA helicase RecG